MSFYILAVQALEKQLFGNYLIQQKKIGLAVTAKQIKTQSN